MAALSLFRIHSKFLCERDTIFVRFSQSIFPSILFHLSFPFSFNFAPFLPRFCNRTMVKSFTGRGGYLFQIKFAHCSQGENSTKRERVHSTVDYQPFRNFLGETNSLRAGSKLSAKWRDSIGLIKRCPIRPLFAPKNPDELLLRWRCQSKPSWT